MTYGPLKIWPSQTHGCLSSPDRHMYPTKILVGRIGSKNGALEHDMAVAECGDIEPVR